MPQKYSQFLLQLLFFACNSDLIAFDSLCCFFFKSTTGWISGKIAARRDSLAALPSLRSRHLYVNVVVSIKYKPFCVGMRRTVLEANKWRLCYFGKDFFWGGGWWWVTNVGAATTTGLYLDAYNSLINNVCIFDVLIRCIVIWNTVWRCIYGTLLWSTVNRRNHLEAKQ